MFKIIKLHCLKYEKTVPQTKSPYKEIPVKNLLSTNILLNSLYFCTSVGKKISRAWFYI